MHRALKALFLIVLVLGYVVPQTALSRSFCLVTLEECECEISPISSCCTSGHEEPTSDLLDPPCCFSLSASPDWFVASSIRPLPSATLITSLTFQEEGHSFPAQGFVDRINFSAPPPGLSGRLLLLECERLLI